MNTEAIANFIVTYIPFVEWYIVFILAHFLTSTMAHIMKKDFKISEWPKFLGTWLMFMLGTILVNGVVVVSQNSTGSVILAPVVNILQGAMIISYFGYYLDNIFKHMNMMGFVASKGLIEFIKSMVSKVIGVGISNISTDTTDTTTDIITDNTTGKTEETNKTGGNDI